MVSLWRVMWWLGSIGFAWVYVDAPRDRWVHLCTRGFTRGAIGVVAFIRVFLDLYGRY